jgi:hypothetical protein
MTAPDIFLFPQRRPIYSLDDPDDHDPAPPVHTLDTLKLPGLILDLFGVSKADRDKHVWHIHIEIEELEDGRQRRITTINHQGQTVNQTCSRAWLPSRER